ncbi:MAG: hypothetical protein H0X36_14205 [Sphingomonadaceae bacterium]|nr:hypothetical protein [Sphingomonadaceae bacterium]
MRIPHLLAAGLLFAGLGVTTTASAQSNDGRDGYSQRDDRGDYRRDDQRDYRGDRRDDRRDWRDHRDNGWHNGWNRNHRRCWVEWRHHRRVRVCR